MENLDDYMALVLAFIDSLVGPLLGILLLLYYLKLRCIDRGDKR